LKKNESKTQSILSWYELCCSPVMLTRIIMGLSLTTVFYFLFQIPALFLVWIFFFASASIWEYCTIQRGILNKIGLGYLHTQDDKLKDWRYLSSNLIERITNPYMTLAILVALILTVLTLKSRNVGICIISIYVFIFAYKIFRFN